MGNRQQKPKGYWNENTCREEAKKYNTRGDFKNNCYHAYWLALKNGWINSYDWFETHTKPFGYWNEQTCRDEAKKYTSKTAFQRGNGSAYAIAQRNGWIKDYDWFVRPVVHNKKWTKETCREEAMKYKSKSEFGNSGSAAYNVARINGWLDDYDWFEELHKPNGYWTKETCREEALKYSTRSGFQKYAGSAYVVSRQNGWLDDYDWFEELRKPSGYWNEQTCLEEAKKYNLRSRFSKGSPSAYNVAKDNGWLEDYYWMVNQKMFTETGRWFNLYVYKWNDLNSVYVGITIDPKQRDWGHHKQGCTVFNFAYDNRIDIPPMEILENHLTPQQAAKKEGEYVEKFKQDGWNVINKAKAGSIGGLGSGKWNKSSCMREAKKYTTKGDFIKGSEQAYIVARKNGWLDDYDWLVEVIKPKGYWNEQTCREEAMKYKSKVEFHDGASRAYALAWEKGWLESYDWFQRPENYNKKWNEETCREEAKKYNSRTEFCRESSGAYEVANQHGWLDSYDWFEKYSKPNGYWDRNTCREEALKYKSLSEFRKQCSSAYTIAWRNGWLENYNWLEVKKGKWNEESCREEAMKYKTLKDFSKGSKGAYKVAYIKGWLKTYDWLEKQKKRNYWNQETCREEALKYNTLQEFRNAAARAYVLAKENGWLDSYDWLERTSVPKGYWNEQTCREEALKYKSRVAFSNGSGGAYEVARKNGWLESYHWLHTPEKWNKKWNEVTCREEAKKYSSRKNFQQGCVSAYNVARRNGWLDSYEWFSEKPKFNYWNEETCREEALKYKTKTEFLKGCRRAYEVSREKGWLKTYEWFSIKSRK